VVLLSEVYCTLEILGSLKNVIDQMRSEEKFEQIWKECTDAVEKLDLAPLQKERIRRRNPRFEKYGSAATQFNPSKKEKLRMVWNEMNDTVSNNIGWRYGQETLEMLREIESFIIAPDKSSESIVKLYQSDFDAKRLELHTNMFHDYFVANYNPESEPLKSFSDVVRIFKSMTTELIKLIRIGLTVPVTTVICETSFFKLRRLKTFTRSSTSARKSNHETIVHVNKDV